MFIPYAKSVSPEVSAGLVKGMLYSRGAPNASKWPAKNSGINSPPARLMIAGSRPACRLVAVSGATPTRLESGGRKGPEVSPVNTSSEITEYEPCKSTSYCRQATKGHELAVLGQAASPESPIEGSDDFGEGQNVPWGRDERGVLHGLVV